MWSDEKGPVRGAADWCSRISMPLWHSGHHRCICRLPPQGIALQSNALQSNALQSNLLLFLSFSIFRLCMHNTTETSQSSCFRDFSQELLSVLFLPRRFYNALHLFIRLSFVLLFIRIMQKVKGDSAEMFNWPNLELVRFWW